MGGGGNTPQAMEVENLLQSVDIVARFVIGRSVLCDVEDVSVVVPVVLVAVEPRAHG